MNNFFLANLLRAVNWLAALIPQPVPEPAALKNCKIISHRGEFDNRLTLENTLPAFRVARDAGVWGIECDIRWTADLVPVVSHDSDGKRLFDKPLVINQLGFSKLRQEIPQIPSLEELILEFGGNMHLMLEIKEEQLLDANKQKQMLEKILCGLTPGRDFHFLLLDPGLIPRVDFVSPEHCLLVPETNVRQLSEDALRIACGGVAGHFYLLNSRLQLKHEYAGQRIGTGFVTSKNSLFRELNRRVEWVFSNDAVKMKQIRDHYLESSNSSSGTTNQ